MKFGEGAIIGGTASAPDGSSTGQALIVSGNIEITDGADLIFQKGESEISFIQFKNATDGTSYNAYFAYQQAEHLYISAGRGADFYLQQRTNVGGDPYTFPVRVFDDGRVKFEVGQSDSNDSATDLPSDVVFHVSGSNDNQKNIVLAGNVVISGSLTTKQRHINTAKYTLSSPDHQYVRWNAAGSNGTPGVNNKFLAPASGKLLSVTIRATSAANGTNISFHKSSNGTEDLNTTATETIGVDMASANTTYQVEFTDTSSFNAGDILGISLNPTNGFGNVDITCVWEFDFTD